MRSKVLMGVLATFITAVSAYGQEIGAGAGRFEIGAFPGGGMFFTESTNGTEPQFGNYALGASFAVNVSRWIGIEAEGGGSVGVRQNFDVGSVAFTDQRTPSMWSYSGNLVVHPWRSDRAVVPYATGGLGGLTMTPYGEVETLGVTSYETYLMSNVGGGLKWFSTHHFGVRADYRFFMVKNNDGAPWFFGNENRYGHRVQAGLIFTY